PIPNSEFMYRFPDRLKAARLPPCPPYRTPGARAFVAAGLLLLWAISVVAQAPQAAPAAQAWPPDARTLMLYMIGNAHIDAPWLWPLSEADAVVHSTFRSALDRMKEDPELTMTTSSSQFYEWVAASDPAMLDEIR